MSFYKGIEQVVSMTEEIKQELATIKRVEANIERHADKVETVFLEVEKKYAQFEKFNDTVQDLDKMFKKIQGDFEKIRVKVEMKLERKDFLDLVGRFDEFEKHTTNLLKLLDERNKTVKQEVDSQFKGLEIEYRKKFDGMRPPSKPLPTPQPPAQQPAQGVNPSAVAQPSGEDSAGGDVAKPGIADKLKGFFLKSEKTQ
jgi:hypothetical protein